MPTTSAASSDRPSCSRRGARWRAKSSTRPRSRRSRIPPPPAFKAIEDPPVLDVTRLREDAGLPVVTDGELRRESFQSELVAAVDGFDGVTIDAWLWGAWHSDELGDKTVERPPDMAVVERLHKRRSLAAEELAFLRGHTDRIAKVTLPSPTLFGNLWTAERSQRAYPTFDAFMDDVVAILVEEVRELA